jgi:RND family efflux transporter MFP subunit
VTVKEGQAVEEGELLIEFDCRRQQAELDAALADEREMKVTLDANAILAKRQAVSTQDVDIAAARAAKAQATVGALRVQLEQCTVYSPFPGRVAAVAIHQHELSGPGRPLATIVGDSDLEVGLIIPSNWLGRIKPGTLLPFTVDETGETLSVRVVRTAAVVDAVSQTAMVSAVFESPNTNIIAGMSGTARLQSHGE